MKPPFYLAFSLLLCLHFSALTQSSSRDFYTTSIEKNLDLALYFKDYQKQKFACDTNTDTFFMGSVRENLFATALLNELLTRFHIAAPLQTNVLRSARMPDEIYGLTVTYNDEIYGFYDCNYTGVPDIILSFDEKTRTEIATIAPLPPPTLPLLNGYISLQDPKRTAPLQYRLMGFDMTNENNWVVLLGQITVKNKQNLTFFADKDADYFSIRRLLPNGKTMYETDYSLSSGKKTQEGELVALPSTRETIKTFDPNTFQEIEQIVETAGALVRQGTWKFYSPDGKVLRTQKYTNGN